MQVEISLPDEHGRHQILSIHTAKMRENKYLSPDVLLEELAAETKNFSGAEIEQVVVSAVYAGQAQQRDVDQAMLLDCIRATSPLSVVMAERLDALREWARGRTVQAD